MVSFFLPSSTSPAVPSYSLHSSPSAHPTNIGNRQGSEQTNPLITLPTDPWLPTLATISSVLCKLMAPKLHVLGTFNRQHSWGTITWQLYVGVPCPFKPSLWMVVTLALPLMTEASSPQGVLDHMIKIQKLRISDQSNSQLQIWSHFTTLPLCPPGDRYKSVICPRRTGPGFFCPFPVEYVLAGVRGIGNTMISVTV